MDDKELTDPLANRGTRITAMLASDLAREIAAEFDHARDNGNDVPAATAVVIDRFRDLLPVANEGPVLLLALAALQLREGYVQPVIHDAALELIDDGEALHAFAAVTSDLRQSRRTLLEMFATDLREFGVGA